MHDAEFRQAEKDWHSFVAKLTERLIEIDDTIPELPVKDVVGQTCLLLMQMHECLAHHICASADIQDLPRRSIYFRSDAVQGMERAGFGHLPMPTPPPTPKQLKLTRVTDSHTSPPLGMYLKSESLRDKLRGEQVSRREEGLVCSLLRPNWTGQPELLW